MSAAQSPLVLELLEPRLLLAGAALAVDFGGSPLGVDLAGQTRIQGLAVDMGAYEYASGVVVNIPDASLAAAIRDALGIGSTDPIYDTDLAGLASLDAAGYGIADLTGLEYCTGLTWLGLGSNSISDLTPLAGLTGLLGTELAFNQIADLSPLESLTSLTWLGLGGNLIDDLTSLSGLVSLQALTLWQNAIVDVSPLAGLGSLTQLRLESNQISDLSSLTGLTGLTNLWITDNPLGVGAYTAGIATIQGNGTAVTFDAPAWLGGTVYDDLDDSGTPDPGEEQSGQTVFLDADDDGTLDWSDGNGNYTWDEGEGERWTTTDAAGYYSFDNLFPGDHAVAVDIAGVDTQYITLAPGEVVTGLDFAIIPGSVAGIEVRRFTDGGRLAGTSDDWFGYSVTVSGQSITDVQVTTPWGETVSMADFVGSGWDAAEWSESLVELRRGRVTFATWFDYENNVQMVELTWVRLSASQWLASGSSDANIHVDFSGGSWDGTVSLSGLASPAQMPNITSPYNWQLVPSDTPTFQWSAWTSPGAGTDIAAAIHCEPGEESSGYTYSELLASADTSWVSPDYLEPSPWTLTVAFRQTDSALVSGVTVTRVAANQRQARFTPDPYSFDDYGNRPSDAQQVTVGGSVDAVLDYDGDVDFFKFTATRGRTYDITADVYDIGDTEIFLFGTDGQTLLNRDDDSGLGWGSRMLWTAPANGTYYLAVASGYYDDFEDLCDYTLRVSQAGWFVADTPAAWWASPPLRGMGLHGSAGIIGYDADAGMYQAEMQFFQQVNLSSPLAPTTVGQPFPFADDNGVAWPAAAGRIYAAENGMEWVNWDDETTHGSEIVALDETAGGYVEAWRIACQSGEIHSIAVAGNLLLVGTQTIDDTWLAYLEVYDLTDPDAPVFLGQVELPDTGMGSMEPDDLFVAGSRVYIEHDAESQTVSVVDISDPANPALLGQGMLPEPSYGGFAVVGDTAWMFTGTELRAYDFTDPNDPQLLSTLSLPGKPGFIYQEGSQIFVGLDQLGVTVVNISNPLSPTIGATFDVAGASGYFAMNANYIYIPTAGGSVAIFGRGQDLVPTFGSLSIPATSLPGDAWRVPVQVQNAGAAKAVGLAEVRLWLDPDATFGNGDEVLILDAKNLKISLNPGASTTFSLSPKLPGNVQPGDYRLVSEFLPTTVVDSDVSNNVIAAAGTQQVAWAFGALPGRTVSTLTVTDPDGTLVTFKITGPGTGYVGLGADWLTLDVTGSTLATDINVTTKKSATPGDDAEARFGAVDVSGSLNKFYCQTSELAGDVNISGAVSWFLMDDVESRSIITIQGLAVAAPPPTGKKLKSAPAFKGGNFRFDDAYDLAIHSAVPITKIQATQWLNGDSVADPALVSTAPTLGELKITGRGRTSNPGRAVVTGDFSAAWHLTSADAAGNGLGALLVAGWLSDAFVQSDFGIGNVIIGGIDGSYVLAGVSAAQGDPMPAASGAFVGSAAIGYFIINGIKGDSSPKFADSIVAAATIRDILVRDVDADNSGAAFGFAAVNAIGRYRRLAGNLVAANLVNVSADLLPDLDYEVRIV
jgi:hypothetical protein